MLENFAMEIKLSLYKNWFYGAREPLTLLDLSCVKVRNHRMGWIVILGVTLLLHCLLNNAFAAQPKLTRSHLSDLLQQPTITALHRDREGALWIGTEQGLHRYDGANLTVFNSSSHNKNWIPDSEIRDIVEDIEGNLLVAPSSGNLVAWDRQTATFEPLISPVSLDKTRLVRLLLTKSGKIWLLTRDSLSLYDPLSHTLSNWIDYTELRKGVGNPRDLTEDKGGSIWIAGDRGLIRLQPENKSIWKVNSNHLSSTGISSITALEFLDDSNLLIGTGDGKVLVWNIDLNVLANKERLVGEGQTYISNFLVYKDLLIIGTDRGLYSSNLTLSGITYLGDKGEGLSNPNIHSLLQDGDYIWVGTIDGLDILSFAPFDQKKKKGLDILA